MRFRDGRASELVEVPKSLIPISTRDILPFSLGGRCTSPTTRFAPRRGTSWSLSGVVWLPASATCGGLGVASPRWLVAPAGECGAPPPATKLSGESHPVPMSAGLLPKSVEYRV